MRFKEVPRFIEELKAYLALYPNTWGFVFEDDIFGVSKKWLEEFAKIYPREVGLPYGCNMRPNLVTPELVKALAETGCRRVNMAIESGDDEVRNFILNRNLAREKLVRAFRLFKEAGVEVKSYNIVGSPHETPAAVLETIKINAEIDPEYMQLTIFYPYEGTPLFDLVVDEHLMADREVTDYFRDTSLEQSSISRAQVIMFNRNFEGLVKHYQRIWKLPGPLKGLAEKATAKFLCWDKAPAVFGTIERMRQPFRFPLRGSSKVVESAC
jgi:radical SAM superfamily enzyme YgiQ (UPF0313 family)